MQGDGGPEPGGCRPGPPTKRHLRVQRGLIEILLLAIPAGLLAQQKLGERVRAVRFAYRLAFLGEALELKVDLR